MFAYALLYAEQEIPYGCVRRGMELHPPASSRTDRTRSSQASRLAADPRRRLLRAKERLSLAVAAEGLPALEDGLRLVQEVAHRRYLAAAERLKLRRRLRRRLGRDPNPSAAIVDSQSAKSTGVGGREGAFFEARMRDLALTTPVSRSGAVPISRVPCAENYMLWFRIKIQTRA
jgi:hypothetical protein